MVLRNYFLFLILLSVFAFSCSYKGDSSATAENSNLNDYLFFTSHAEVVRWAEHREQSDAQSSGRAPRIVLPRTDPIYKKIDKQFIEVWEAFREVYPAETEGLPLPQVAILKDKTPDAYVLLDYEIQKIPWMVEITTASLDDDKSVDGILGLIAHELTHAVFKHPLSNTSEGIKKYYFASKENEPLGLLMENNEIAQNMAEEWIRNSVYVNRSTDKEFNGIPNPAFDFTIYGSLSRFIFRSEVQKRPQCESASKAFIEFLSLSESNTNIGDWSLKLNEDQKKTLNVLTSTYISIARECLGEKKETLFSLFKKQYGTEIHNIIKQRGNDQILKTVEADAKIFEHSYSIIDGLLSITRPKLARMRDIERNKLFPFLRYYNHEEAADDGSVKVMQSLGKTEAISEFFWRVLRQYKSDEDCKNILLNGDVPNYGTLNDPHHSLCYRIYHVKALANYLSGP